MDRLDPRDERRDMAAGTDSQAGYAGEPGGTTAHGGDVAYTPTQGSGGYPAQPGGDRPLTGDSVPAGYGPGAPGTGAATPGAGYETGAGMPTGSDGYDAGVAGGPVDHWNARQESGWGLDQELVGFHVEATDGRIGKIDEASTAVDASYLVVDTGPWIFGKKVMLPAGVVQRVDSDDKVVYVNCAKEQIKSSPEFDPNTYTTPEYRDTLGTHYGNR